ncbi:hypothetical protein [Pedobacter immunditicola]|uniref:hypothetical protein n=1 Tax=Pedobacter immunditicola TaxID=3133440 RepID=UPI0030B62F43
MMITPENNPENNRDEKDEKRKTIYKETQDRGEDDKDPGESSSASDIGRTDFIKKGERKHNPLGSGHEPGTTPGSNI